MRLISLNEVIIMRKFFTQREIVDLLVSTLVASMIFHYTKVVEFKYGIIVTILSFLIHELMHKFAAKRFNCTSVYKIHPIGIAIGLVLMFLGIVFVMPGVVEVYPYKYGRWGFRVVSLTIDEVGYIAMAGIASSMGIALTSRLLSIYWPAFTPIYKINAIMTFFSLLPLPKSDGSRILQANSGFWVVLFIISLFMITDVFLV